MNIGYVNLETFFKINYNLLLRKNVCLENILVNKNVGFPNTHFLPKMWYTSFYYTKREVLMFENFSRFRIFYFHL